MIAYSSAPQFSEHALGPSDIDAIDSDSDRDYDHTNGDSGYFDSWRLLASARLGGCTFGLSEYLAAVDMPVLRWTRDYSLVFLVKDAIAGVTVFIMLVAQGMAYALVCDIPMVYGLYTACFPQFIYALFATSRQLSIGPMAITSLMLGLATQGHGRAHGSEEYIQLAQNITFLVGVFTFAMGVCKCGELVNLVSGSVLSGFVTASACVLQLTQAQYILGISVPKFAYSHQTIGYLLNHMGEANGYAAAIGLGSWLLLYILKELRKAYKGVAALNPWYNACYIASNAGSLVAIAVTASISYTLIQRGISLNVVGVVPAGIKAPQFTFVDLPLLLSVMPSSFIIAVVSFTGNWAIAKKYATPQFPVSATQELIATGLANMCSSPFFAFAVTGGLARTAVNAESGAQTQLSGCIASVCIVLSLLFFTSFFQYIPLAILGAVVNVSVMPMVDFQDMWSAYKADKQDCVVMVVTFLSTFFVGMSEGLVIGVTLSIAFTMKPTAYPQIAVLGRVKDEPQLQERGMFKDFKSEDEGRNSIGHFGGRTQSDHVHICHCYQYKDIQRYPTAEQIPEIAIVRMNASLYFANTEYFKEYILNIAATGTFHSSSKPIRMVVLDMSVWIHIDLAGLATLQDVHRVLAVKGIQLSVICEKGHLLDKLLEAQFIMQLGEQFVYDTHEHAVQSFSRLYGTTFVELNVLKDFHQ